ncbi:MAG: TRAP transporter substrate-binding protein [Candidatus Atribacteria bacterium]|nr:TRAP transporter substrate-binding protein [Candidatus Atribacteria bacterium]
MLSSKKITKVMSRSKLMIIFLLMSMLFLGIGGNGLAEEYVIKYAYVFAPVGAQQDSAVYLKERIEELSGGRLSVQLYPSGQLGDKVAVEESLRSGTIEMCDAAATDLSSWSKMWSIFSLPYNFVDDDHMFRVLRDKDVSKMFNEDAESIGFKVLAWTTVGSRSVLNSKRPIYRPKDLNGIKVRVMADPFLAKVVKLMGAIPVPLAWTDVYVALQQGTIDGAENSPSILFSNNLHEVTKYFSLTEHFRMPGPQLMSLKFFNSLPEDLQKVLMQAGKETEEFSRKNWILYDEESLKKMEDSGIKINKLSEADKEAFKEAVKPIYDDFLSDADQKTKELYNLMNKVK